VIYGLYQAAGGMMTHEYRQSVIANNLANADTIGFKRDVATFAERLRADQAGMRFGAGDAKLDPLSGGIWLGQSLTDFSSGSLRASDNPLDVAIDGAGFFVVSVDGQEQFTRDGRFVMDLDGRLRAVDGAAVLGPGNAPIQLNPRGGRARIDESGRIYQNDLAVGQLAVADFDDYDALQKTAAGRFIAPDGLTPVQPIARIKSGVLEDSGAIAVTEMVSMIESSRAYQINAQMVSLQDESAGRLLSLLRA
jgi:flagellar basal-body rod protein FlgG